MRIGDKRIIHLDRGGSAWPRSLLRLGPAEPERLSLVGNPRLLDRCLTALFCSSRLPGDLLVRSYDIGRALAAAGVPIISGFQSPVERELLTLLLAGSGSIVLCPARGLETMALQPAWQRALASGRMLLLSPFPAEIRRATLRLSERRNRIAAALASRILIIHATPGGRLSHLVNDVAGLGHSMYCADHPANADLRFLGALPFPLRLGFAPADGLPFARLPPPPGGISPFSALDAGRDDA